MARGRCWSAARPCDPDIRVFILPANMGKGAAILHGLKRAAAAGVSHVVTFDADGQHEAADIEIFVTLSRAHPEAMVLGVPLFDDTAPKIRVRGHRIANFWANLVAPRSGIGSSLFGFRVCPVVPLLRAFAETRWMRRFDFDSEAVIRMSWRGVPIINVPTRVRYFRREDGGVSHFRYLRDNLLLLFMYHRLFAERLSRRFVSFREPTDDPSVRRRPVVPRPAMPWPWMADNLSTGPAWMPVTNTRMAIRAFQPDRAGWECSRGAATGKPRQIIPPLIEMICAEIYPAASEARNATSAATSSGVPARFIGTSRAICSALNALSAIGEAMIPGATAFTVMPRLASSSARARVAPCNPAFAAA